MMVIASSDQASSSFGVEELTPVNSKRRYSAGELLNLKDSPASNVRPKYLNFEFADAQGIWDPHKWHASFAPTDSDTHVDHEKENQAIDPRFSKVKDEENVASGLVLSPQRRSFGSGCQVKDVGGRSDKRATTARVGTKTDSTGRGTNISSFRGQSQSGLVGSRGRFGSSSHSEESTSNVPRQQNIESSVFQRGSHIDQSSHQQASYGGGAGGRRFESQRVRSSRLINNSRDKSTRFDPEDEKKSAKSDNQDSNKRPEPALSPTFADFPEAGEDNVWLDVKDTEEFSFVNDLESAKEQFNWQLDEENARQVQGDLQAHKTQSWSVENTEQKNQQKQNEQPTFDLAEFLQCEEQERSEEAVHQSHSSAGASRYTRLFRSNDPNKQIDAEYDRYLQHFEFDPETYDLRMFPNQVPEDNNNNHYLPNHRQQMDHFNMPPAANANDYLLNTGECRTMRNNVMTNGHSAAAPQVMSVAELEAVEMGTCHDSRPRMPGDRVLTAAEFERDYEQPGSERRSVATPLPDDKSDMSAFNSLLNQLSNMSAIQQRDPNMAAAAANQKRSFAAAASAQAARSGRVGPVEPTRVNSPGPELIQSVSDLESSHRNPYHHQSADEQRKTALNLYAHAVKQQQISGGEQHQHIPGSTFLSHVNMNAPASLTNSLMASTQQNHQRQQQQTKNPDQVLLPPNLMLFQQQVSQQQQLSRNAHMDQRRAPHTKGVQDQNAGRVAAPPDMFTPTAVMRNLSIETSTAPSSSSHTPPENVSPRNFFALSNQGAPFNGQSNVVLPPNLMAAAAAITAQQNLKAAAVAAASHHNPLLPGGTQSQTKAGAPGLPAVGFPPNLTGPQAAAMFNPFMMNQMLRGASPSPPISLTVSTAGGGSAPNGVNPLQQLIIRQQLATNMLIRAQMLRQLSQASQLSHLSSLAQQPPASAGAGGSLQAQSLASSCTTVSSGNPNLVSSAAISGGNSPGPAAAAQSDH